MDPRHHWETVYRTKAPTEVSWYQAIPQLSLTLIQQTAPAPSTEILDVGGGASTLVDALLACGYARLSVLDISGTALSAARTRLGAPGASVRWIEADIQRAALPVRSTDLWHDRAVFHFLTSPADRDRYRTAMRTTLRPGGHVIVATFAEDGPTRCSGLDVVQYSPEQLAAEFGAEFAHVTSAREVHLTPGGTPQAFTYGVFRYSTSSPANPRP